MRDIEHRCMQARLWHRVSNVVAWVSRRVVEVGGTSAVHIAYCALRGVGVYCRKELPR